PGIATAVLLLLTLVTAFLSHPHASQFLSRRRRANGIFEESKKGNLERECVEEFCNKEEAREVFENDLETEYFYPKYLGEFALILIFSLVINYEAFNCLRKCHQFYFLLHPDIPDQCTPSPCNSEGSVKCMDKKGAFKCTCKEGWEGDRCQNDINECEAGTLRKGDCSHACYNVPGSYRCFCRDGFFMHSDKHTCIDRNECLLKPNICGSAYCRNLDGNFECKCDEGYIFNSTTKTCMDVDECAENTCARVCVNYPGSYSCFCDGREGEKLATDGKNCLVQPIFRKAYILNMGELFSGIPVVYLRFKIPVDNRFTAQFDFRTYDSEGIIVYAETNETHSWFMLALRGGKLEVQFKNEFTPKVTTSGGPSINNGGWYTISIVESQNSILVKVDQAAVIKINSPGQLFSSVNGTTEIKISIAGLPRGADRTILPINPRLDGCMRGWNWMNLGAAGIGSVIQNIKTKHCYLNVEKGSYFPGTGYAMLQLNYSMAENNSVGSWKINLKLTVRSSKDTGVLFALASDEKIPLSLAFTDSYSLGTKDKQNLILVMDNVIVVKTDELHLCNGEKRSIQLNITAEEILLEVDGNVYGSHLQNFELEQQLSLLDGVMQEPVNTTLGGVPDIPITATPVSALFNGCMELEINDKTIDLDEAIHKHNDIQSHSCPSMNKD
uniref:Vitamin K-dependent protein S n=1 Tax=Callorhinchus milii TaxID=7868 RepID=A0A4W3JIM7_CALMI